MRHNSKQPTVQRRAGVAALTAGVTALAAVSAVVMLGGAGAASARPRVLMDVQPGTIAHSLAVRCAEQPIVVAHDTAAYEGVGLPLLNSGEAVDVAAGAGVLRGVMVFKGAARVEDGYGNVLMRVVESPNAEGVRGRDPLQYAAGVIYRRGLRVVATADDTVLDLLVDPAP